LNIPVHTRMTENDALKVVRAIKMFLGNVS
jgi:dTDP-4-amino-4,6-dideoxygalactose transaminase